MSKAWVDFCAGVFCVGAGVLFASMAVSLAMWAVGTVELSKCAAKHNVYACEYVIRPVTSKATE